MGRELRLFVSFHNFFVLSSYQPQPQQLQYFLLPNRTINIEKHTNGEFKHLMIKMMMMMIMTMRRAMMIKMMTMMMTRAMMIKMMTTMMRMMTRAMMIKMMTMMMTRAGEKCAESVCHWQNPAGAECGFN